MSQKTSQPIKRLGFSTAHRKNVVGGGKQQQGFLSYMHTKTPTPVAHIFPDSSLPTTHTRSSMHACPYICTHARMQTPTRTQPHANTRQRKRTRDFANGSHGARERSLRTVANAQPLIISQDRQPQLTSVLQNPGGAGGGRSRNRVHAQRGPAGRGLRPRGGVCASHRSRSGG